MEQSMPKVVFKIPSSVILHLIMTILSSHGTYSGLFKMRFMTKILETKAEKQSKECLNHVLFKTLALVSNEFFHPFWPSWLVASGPWGTLWWLLSLPRPPGCPDPDGGTNGCWSSSRPGGRLGKVPACKSWEQLFLLQLTKQNNSQSTAKHSRSARTEYSNTQVYSYISLNIFSILK